MYRITQPFPSHQNFLDPPLTKDGNPYGPERYKEIVKERYLISRNIHTSYSDLGNITPLERTYLMQFIADDNKKQRDYINSLGKNTTKTK